MVPCEPDLLAWSEVADLVEDLRGLLVRMGIRVDVAGELLLLWVAILSWLLVVLVVDDLEDSEVLRVVAAVRAEGCKEWALAVDDASELGNSTVAGENVEGSGHV